MRTHLGVTRELTTQPWPVVERFLRSPELWLPPPARRIADGMYVTTARLGPLLHDVRAEVGDAWTLTDVVSRRITWMPCDRSGTPIHTTALPAFDGRIRVRHGAHTVTASMEGDYEPPGGPLGAALDRSLLHRSAEVTVRALLEDILTSVRSPIDEEAPR